MLYYRRYSIHRRLLIQSNKLIAKDSDYLTKFFKVWLAGLYYEIKNNLILNLTIDNYLLRRFFFQYLLSKYHE